MERIPTEVWEIIFGHLVHSRDLESAYNTCQLWREILERSKSSWMFDLVFEQVEEYIDINNALKCRRVCKRWLHGVNNYLETRLRPTFEEQSEPIRKLKTDERLTDFWPSNLFSNVIEICNEERAEMLLEYPNYSGSLPLVGRWLQIYYSETQTIEEFRPDFLDSFGSYVWFLQLSVFNVPAGAMDALKFILKYLPYFPNLKKLSLQIYLTGDSQGPEIKNELNEYVETRGAVTLPKCMEVADMRYMEGPGYQELRQVLLEMLIPICRNLQSLFLDNMSNVTSLETGSIADLSVTLTSEAAVRQMLQITSPVRRLKLGRDSCTKVESLFKVAKHFRETLRNLDVEVNEYKEKGDDEPLDKWNAVPVALGNMEALDDLKNLKRFTFQASCLFSLNFLCGLNSSLEYLDVSVAFDSLEDMEIQEPIHQNIGFKEELDLLEVLKVFLNCKKKRLIYGSNVWNKLPKLRELTVQVALDAEALLTAEEFEFRRDIYDRLSDKSN